jgi:hypothetical protein
MFWVEVSVRIKQPPPALPAFGARRSARILICRSLSSPDMYSTFSAGMFMANCSIRVDLPMPGSPPISTKLPGTIPPPNTRLNSLSGVSKRLSSSNTTSATKTGLFALCVDVELVAFQSGMEPLAFSVISSTKVFHSPHDGHLPSHFGVSKPQLWQK